LESKARKTAMRLLKLNAGNILRQQTSSLTENLRIVVQRLRYIFKFSAGEPQDIGYLLVKNPARFRSHAFEDSALAELFRKNRVPTLELPAITSTTLEKIAEASVARKKHLTFTEAVKIADLHQMCRFEIEHFLNRVFTQCEDAARVLLPDPAMIKNKVSRPTDRLARKPVDELKPHEIHE